MSSENTAITASEFPLALFSLGLPLTYAAFSLSGFRPPSNLDAMSATVLAVLGLLLDMLRSGQRSEWPLWLTAGIPALFIGWLSFNSLEPLVRPLQAYIPLLMEVRPLIFLLVSILWITIFPLPTPEQISFWSGWLSLFICIEFTCRFFVIHQPALPNLLGTQGITGPILLAGFCATLHNSEEHWMTRMVILAGIFCSLGRDAIFGTVLILILFGPKGGLKKVLLTICVLLFTYLSLQVQDMTFINRQDLPAYWLWFTLLDLLSNNADFALYTGLHLFNPLPLNVPPSLWTIWHGQEQIWTGSEIYLFHIQPFWLHILAAWGLCGLSLFAAVFTYLYKRYPSAMMGGLITAVSICGFFSPLFFSPATALVLFPAFIAAAAPEVQSFKFE
ncbi:hypothetical protein [Maridesulfovibrio sp.]|uniref:hypothetical protein n=1 Tax=Maridesulfovibrio sp. TaxID=2795000 RepID=UPI0029F58403|nr:hypothetical protein [Maridesulfovibrio sp.]